MFGTLLETNFKIPNSYCNCVLGNIMILVEVKAENLRYSKIFPKIFETVGELEKNVYC